MTVKRALEELETIQGLLQQHEFEAFEELVRLARKGEKVERAERKAKKLAREQGRG